MNTSKGLAELMELAPRPVVSNAEIALGTYLMWLDAPDIATTAMPGQFAMLRCSDSPDITLRRPFSIHAAEDDRIAFLYKVVGKGTAKLALRRPGEPVDVLGPLGRGFSFPSSPSRLLMIAGGTGIAPLRLAASHALGQGHEVTLLLGARSAAEVYPTELLSHEITISVATEDGSCGEKCMVTSMVPRFISGVNGVYACGPEAMYRALDRSGILLGMPTQISLEIRLGCGLGACYGCTVETVNGPKRVCLDGPVFQLDEVSWETADRLLM